MCRGCVGGGRIGVLWLCGRGKDVCAVVVLEREGCVCCSCVTGEGCVCCGCVEGEGCVCCGCVAGEGCGCVAGGRMYVFVLWLCGRAKDVYVVVVWHGKDLCMCLVVVWQDKGCLNCSCVAGGGCVYVSCGCVTGERMCML